MKPHHLLSGSEADGQQQTRASGTFRRVGDAREPTAESSGQPSNSRGVMDPEQTTTTKTRKAPWWRRKSPWWLLAVMPFTSIAASAKIAPRLEIYTVLACAVHKPDIAGQDFAHHTSKCGSDPVVQAAVAKLIAVVAACSGVLSLVTTGYWGAYSDRHGRARVLGITIIGLLLDDLIFILVTKFPAFFPGGYWFLVVGSTIEGCLGGFTTGVAAFHTYLTDTTDEHDRSRILSLNVGLLFTGVAVGPTLGSFLVRGTGQTLSVFYAAVIFISLFSCFLWFILPESITEQQMTRARANYNDGLLRGAATEPSFIAAFLHKIRRAITFLSPLTIFLPSNLKSPNNKNMRDWSVTLLALAYGCTISTMGSYQNKLQYAVSQFGWSTEIMGYWLSLIGAARAVAMILILPVAIKLFKRRFSNPTPPTDPMPSEVTPLLEPLGDDPRPTSPIRRVNNDSVLFDIGLAKLALVVDTLSFLFMGLARTGWQFTLFGVFGAFGLGFNPAMQSVTLALYTRRGGTESGRLFGALSVIQAFATSIVGPAVYGSIYARTVATFPRAIFFVTVVAVIISFILLLLVRLPDIVEDKNEDPVGEADLLGTQVSPND